MPEEDSDQVVIEPLPAIVGKTESVPNFRPRMTHLEKGAEAGLHLVSK